MSSFSSPQSVIDDPFVELKVGLLTESLLFAGAVHLTSAATRAAFAAHVAEPYMDEEFHVAQAERICNGDYETWDSAITTLPGTYIFSLIIFRLFWWAPGVPNTCALEFLRGTSSFSLALLGAVVYAWARVQSRAVQAWPSGQPNTMTEWQGGVPARPASVQSRSECGISRPTPRGSLSALKANWMASPWVWPALLATCVVSIPPLWFSSHLYYTDSTGLLFVLLCFVTAPMYRVPAYETGHTSMWTAVPSAMFGAFAVLCRQTNIVWVGFVAAVTLATHASVHFQAILHRAQGHTSQVAWQLPPLLALLSRLDLALVCWSVLRMLRRETQQAVALMWPYLAVLAAFLAFLSSNNWSVVLGHAEYHAVGQHWAHTLYLLAALGALTLLALLPTASGRRSITEHAQNLWEFVLSPLRVPGTAQRLLALARAALLLAPLALALYAGTRGAVKHPFITADNRHFTFYACSRFLCKYDWAPWAAAVGACVAGGLAVSQLLRPGEAVFRLHRAISVSSAKLRVPGESIAAVAGVPLWVQHAALTGHPAVGRSHAILLSDMLRSAWSFAWIAACVLTLVPAELVEPRYFAVPTALWLMHARFTRRQLFLLCVCFIAVNFFTTVVFLHHTFDAGKSRFMW